jgi:hypothetical protein
MANDLFLKLEPGADIAFAQYILSRTPHELQDEMLPLVEGSINPKVPLTPIDSVFVQSYNVAGDTTLVVPGVVANVGEMLLLILASDNSGPAGVSSVAPTITDPSGNVWTRQVNLNRTQGGNPNDGVTLTAWTAPVLVAMNAVSITIGFSTATPAKAATMKRMVPFQSQTVTIKTVGAGQTGSNSSFNGGSVVMSKGETIVGLLAVENDTISQGDADTTGGAWSAPRLVTANAAGGLLATSIQTQHKTPTVDGNQNYNHAIGANRDYAATLMVFTTS